MKIAEIITEAKLEEYIEAAKKDNQKLVIDFFATWCGPCQMYIPIFDKVSNQLENVKMVKIDIDTITEPTAIKYGVSAVPTTVMIENGEVIGTKQGFIVEAELIKFIENN